MLVCPWKVFALQGIERNIDIRHVRERENKTLVHTVAYIIIYAGFFSSEVFYTNRGAVVAQWIRLTLNREVPGVNLLAAAVVLLRKALYILIA